MNDKRRLISNRGAQDLSRPAVFIQESKLFSRNGEKIDSISRKKKSQKFKK